MIKINGLQKKYKDVVALDVDILTINKGECFGLVGNNGAGKTTLFRLILDLIKPESGEVTILDDAVARCESWKQHVGAFIDQSFLIDFLTPEEYFSFVGSTRNLDVNQIQDFLHENKDFFNDEVLGKNKYIREFSLGNQQKIGIMGSILGYPEIVILDEPFNSLDPTTQIRLVNLIRKLNTEKGITFLVSSHDINHIAEACNRIVVLEKGKIIHDFQTNNDTLLALKDYFSL